MSQSHNRRWSRAIVAEARRVAGETVYSLGRHSPAEPSLNRLLSCEPHGFASDSSSRRRPWDPVVVGLEVPSDGDGCMSLPSVCCTSE